MGSVYEIWSPIACSCFHWKISLGVTKLHYRIMFHVISSVPLRIYFTPNSEKEVNFNLVSSVKRKSTPLTLNVKAEGYSMNCLVLCEDSTGTKIEFRDNCINEINFGEVSWLQYQSSIPPINQNQSHKPAGPVDCSGCSPPDVM